VLPRERHVFVTGIYQVLYALGYPLLEYMLLYLGGSFSGLIESIYAWRQRDHRRAPIDGALLKTYVGSRLGARHHLTGLVTYMIHASDLRRIAARHAIAADDCDFSEERAYRLGDQARVLRDVPDCPGMLAHLLDHPKEKAPVRFRRRRRNLLLQMTPGDRDNVRNYILTDAAASVLESFERPQAVSEFRISFPRKSGYPAPPVEFLRALVSRRVLQRA
jgi:hypothetical protein